MHPKRGDELAIIDFALATVSAPPVPSSEYTTRLRNLNDDYVSGATRKRVHRIPKLCRGSHVHRPRFQMSPVGQCVIWCSYPISRKKWMRSVSPRSAAAIE